MAFTIIQAPKGRHITLHREKKKVRQCIQHIQRELYTFRKKYFLFNVNDSHQVALKEFQHCIEVNRHIFENPTPPLNSNEFQKWIEAKAISLNWSKQFLEELKKIALRASSFETLVSQSIIQLKNAYSEHICKYCRSFINELTNSSVKVPYSYERNIQVWKEQIQRGYQIICAQATQLKALENNFYEYLNNILHVTNLMLDMLNHFPQILQPMSRWLLEDFSYIRKIQNEVFSLSKRRDKINEAVRSQQFRVTEARNKFQRISFSTQILWQDVKNLSDELKSLDEQQNELRNSQQIMEHEQEQKKIELADAETRFQNRTSNSSTLYDLLIRLMENRKMDINKLNLSLNQGSIDLSRVLKAKFKCSIKLRMANSKYETSRQVQQELDNILQRELKSLVEIKDSLRDVHNQMETLQKIKDQYMTVQSEFETPNISVVEDNENVFESALHLVAKEIGVDWVCLYQVLPFTPPRNIHKRIRDIEDIKQRKLSVQEMALESLQKWKQHSATSSVLVLKNLLERLDKTDILMQLKKHSLVINKK